MGNRTVKLLFHEPLFLPPLDFFSGLVHSDIWVVMDHVPYSIRTRQNRCRIRTRTGIQLCSVSVKRPCNKLIFCTMIDNWQPWKRKFLEAVERSYMGSPFYTEYYEDLKYYVEAPNVLLETLNVQTTLWIAHLLKIEPQIVYSKSTCQNLSREESVKLLCSRLGGEEFHEQFIHPYYKQRYEPFEEGLSILDALFSISATETRRLLK